LVTLAGSSWRAGWDLSFASNRFHPPRVLRFGQRFRVPWAGAFSSRTALLFLLVFALGVYLYRSTRFGRNTIAIGGNETSALLMGLPVGKTKVGIYALSGFCASLAGIVYTLYTYSGNPTAGTMLELDAIAAVVSAGRS
jgi:simple sugar transport system permease protein